MNSRALDSSQRPLRELLDREGWSFDFYQAVKVLQAMAATERSELSMGESIDPRREAVRFRSRVGLDFPATDVEAVELPRTPVQPASMEVNFMGLAGISGPLPDWVTELVMDRTRDGDTVLRDFLDLFNHRLISLLFRGRKKYRPALTHTSPHGTRAARVGFALLGLGVPALQNRMGVPDRALLPYAGLLAGPRSQIGLERLLEGYFQVPVKVQPFQGDWWRLADHEVTRLGRLDGQNARLGEGAVLGRRVRDQQTALEIRLGPLTLRQHREFLPNGRRHQALDSLTRFYLGWEYDFRFRLEISARRVPPIRLGAGRDVRLGWTSWLITGPLDHNDSQVVLGR